MEFKYKIGDLNEIIEEKGNTFKALRKISFNDKEEKVDIRTWYSNADGSEKMSKGCQLSEEGANNLTVIMTRVGYGETEELLHELKKRDDFIPSLSKVLSNEELEAVGVDISKVDSSEYYDPLTDIDFNDEGDE